MRRHFPTDGFLAHMCTLFPSATLWRPGPRQGQDFNFDPAMALQCPGAFTNRRSGGEHIIDQTDHGWLRQTAGSNLKGTSEIFSPLDPAEGGLGRGIPDPDQPIRPDSLLLLREKQMGQDRCLIEPPAAVPIKMERDWKNPLAVGKHRQIAAPDNFSKTWNYRGVTSVLEPLDEFSDRRFVADQRPGKTVGWRRTEACAAELVSFLLTDQLHAADPAEGPEQIPEAFPATAAKLAGTTGIESYPTYRTNRWKKQIHRVFLQPPRQSHHCRRAPVSV
jgi:hypothetical protein